MSTSPSILRTGFSRSPSHDTNSTGTPKASPTINPIIPSLTFIRIYMHFINNQIFDIEDLKRNKLKITSQIPILNIIGICENIEIIMDYKLNIKA